MLIDIFLRKTYAYVCIVYICSDFWQFAFLSALVQVFFIVSCGFTVCVCVYVLYTVGTGNKEAGFAVAHVDPFAPCVYGPC